MKLKKTLYLPIEIKVRELPHKLYLSCEALKRNYRVYLGNKSDIFQLIDQKKNKGGVFFAKGQIRDKPLNLIKKKCDKFAIFDEEMNRSMQNYLPNTSMLNFYKYMINLRYNKLNLKNADKFYCFNKDIFKSAKIIFNEKKNILIPLMGHPKEDLLKKKNLKVFEKHKKKIKKYYGDFILFNSDFYSLKDPKREIDSYEKIMKETGGKRSNHDAKQYSKMIIYKHKTLKYFIKFLGEIDENLGSIKMMIRPHPRENIDDWKKITKKFKNIYVVAPIDDVTSYILASKGVMHNGCSTGISSLLLGKSTAYFYEKNNSSYKHFFQNDMLKSSIEVSNSKDFYKWLTSLEKNSNNHIKKNNYYKNFKKQELSCKIILDDLNKDAINREPKIETLKVVKKSKFYYVMKYLLSTKFLNFFKKPITIGPQIKIPNGIKKKEIEKYLREFNNINGLKKKIEVRQLTENLIELS